MLWNQCTIKQFSVFKSTIIIKTWGEKLFYHFIFPCNLIKIKVYYQESSFLTELAQFQVTQQKIEKLEISLKQLYISTNSSILQVSIFVHI